MTRILDFFRLMTFLLATVLAVGLAVSAQAQAPGAQTPGGPETLAPDTLAPETAAPPTLAPAAPALQDMWIGANEAPVTIIEYASLTCPSCARFHQGIFAELVSTYIDDGRVRLIYRDFPLDDLALRAAMLARCVGESGYFGMLDFLFEQQESWAKAEKPLEALLATVKKAGMGEQASKACLENKQVENFILQSRLEGETKHSVHSTPTLIIGDTVIPGPKTLDQVLAVVDPLLQAGGTAEPLAPETLTPPEPASQDEPSPFGTWLLVAGVVVALLVGARIFAKRRKK